LCEVFDEVYKYRKPWNIEKFLNLTPENGIHTKSRVQKQSWQTKHFTNSKFLSRNVFKNRHTLKALSKFINIHKLPLIFIKWGFNKVSCFIEFWDLRLHTWTGISWTAIWKVCGPKFSQIIVSKVFQIDTLNAHRQYRNWKFCKNVKVYKLLLVIKCFKKQKLIKNLKGEIDILTFPIIDIFKFRRLLNFFSR